MGYTEIFTPGLPPHVQFPPVFPLILTPIVHLWGYNFLLMHILVITLGVLAIWVIVILFTEYTGKYTALFIGLLTGTNHLILANQQEIVSEIPYLLFSLLAIYFVKYYSKKETILNPSLILASLFISITYLTRTIGISIYLACIFFFIIELFYTEHRIFIFKKGLALGILSIIPYLLWSFRNIKLKGSSSVYLSSFFLIDPYAPEMGYIGFGDIFRRISDNLSLYKIAIGESFITFTRWNILIIPFLILTVIGCVFTIYRRKG